MSEKVRGIDPPLCKLCHVRHHMREPHVFKGGGGALKAAKKAVAAIPPAKAKGKRRGK